MTASHEIAAVAVKSATGFWTMTGIWTGIGLAVTCITAIIRWGPDWLKARIGEAERLRLDRRSDYKMLRRDFERLKAQNTVVISHCLAVDTRMGQLEWVIGLTLDEIDRLDSSNEIAKKAREMFSRMFPVIPLSEQLEKLNHQLDRINVEEDDEENPDG